MGLKNVVLGIAIIILTLFVGVYGINTFYEKPEYNDFCGERGVPLKERLVEPEICPAVCVEMYEIKEVQCVAAPCNPVCEYNECGSGCGPDGINTFGKLSQCEITLTGKNCYNIYDEEMKKYSKNVFLIAIPLGILIIAIGVFFFSLESVGVGLMGGGIGTLLYGTWGFFWQASDVIRFIISLIGLIAIIGMAYWLNSKNWNVWKRKGKRKWF